MTTTPCRACAGTGARAATDGFSACSMCGGTGAAPSERSRACCAAHDDHQRHSETRLGDGVARAVSSIESLSLVTDAGAPATTKKDFTLVVFVKDSCGACRRFAPTLRAFADAESSRVDVVAVSCEASNSHACLGAHGSSFLRPAMDAEGSEARARRVDATNAALRGFSVSTLPRVVVVDRRRRETVTTWGYTVVSMNPRGAVDAWTRGSNGLVPEVIANGANRLNRALSACAYGGT